MVLEEEEERWNERGSTDGGPSGYVGEKMSGGWIYSDFSAPNCLLNSSQISGLILY